MAAGLSDHFLRGAFYPEGGGQVVAARLVEAIRAYGGEVRTNTPVQRVRIENGRVAGVVVGKPSQHAEEIDAPVVVSNADLKRTFLELVGAEHFSPQTVERIRSLRMALPLFCVYAGLDIDLAAKGFPNANHYVFSGYDFEAAYDELEAGKLSSKTMTYITTASLKDPVSRHLAPPGCTNVQIMTLAPLDYSVWNVERGPTEGGRYHRDPEYRRRKEEVCDHLLESAEAVIPGLRRHLVWKEAATPVSQERFTRSTGGTSYGIEMSADQAGPFRVGPRTEVPGLFLCGASTPSGPGISGVMRSGVDAAGQVLETNLLRPILEGRIFGDRNTLPPLSDGWDPWKVSH